MKREEAEKLAKGALFRPPALWFKHSDPPAPTITESVTDAILSAYRRGAEEMRERCAVQLDMEAAQSQADGFFAEAGAVDRQASALRKLPLTDEEPNGQGTETRRPAETA